MDKFNNILTVLDKGLIKKIVKTDVDTSNISLKADQIEIKDGKALNNDTLVIGDPGRNFQINITYEYKHWLINSNISVFIRNCSRGEVLLNKKCQICLKETYSLIEYDSSNYDLNNINQYFCKVCMENADCKGSDIILARDGYFRLNSRTDMLIPCIVFSAFSNQLMYYKDKKELNNKMEDNSLSEKGFYQQICTIGY